MEVEKTKETIAKLSQYLKKNLAIKAENGIYDFSKEYTNTFDMPQLLESVYDTKLDEILESLANNSFNFEYNENDEKKKTEIEQTVYKLAFLTPEELNPDEYEKLLKKKEILEYKKNDVKTSDAFKCVKCKKRRVDVTQAQVMSGDEPATNFVECLECGHKWSFH